MKLKIKNYKTEEKKKKFEMVRILVRAFITNLLQFCRIFKQTLTFHLSSSNFLKMYLAMDQGLDDISYLFQVTCFQPLVDYVN